MFRIKLSRSRGGNIALLVLLVVVGLFMLVPLYYTVISAFKPLDEIFIYPPRFYVLRPTTKNFIALSQVTENFWVPFSRYIFNSFFVSILGTAGHVIIGSLAAFPMARHNYVGKRFVNGMVTLSLLFTSTVTAIPAYIVQTYLHLIDTYWALILPLWQFTLGLYLMKQFMTMLPEEMFEAARIDGASEWRVYASIVMPNVKPAWLTVIVLAFQQVWNSGATTTVGNVLIYKENLKMLPAIYPQLFGAGMSRAGVTFAFTLLLMIPPILLFLVTQNSIIETMTNSGIKG